MAWVPGVCQEKADVSVLHGIYTDLSAVHCPGRSPANPCRAAKHPVSSAAGPEILQATGRGLREQATHGQLLLLEPSSLPAMTCPQAQLQGQLPHSPQSSAPPNSSPSLVIGIGGSSLAAGH